MTPEEPTQDKTSAKLVIRGFTGDYITRAKVPIGSLEIDGFMLPDGSYWMSQAGAASAITEPPVYTLRFLRSKDSKALLGDAYTDYTPESLEVESEGRGQTRINALPLEVVSAYWLYRAFKGNRAAFVLVWALLSESLERRFDNAFGVSRNEQEINALLAERTQIERDLSALGEAFAVDDDTKRERDYFEKLLRDRGIDPYGPET